MKTKKLAILFALSMSSLGFSQMNMPPGGPQGFGGPLPEYTGASNFGMQPSSMTPPGAFTAPPQRQLGEQPAYAQTGNPCYDRNYRSDIVGPVQANGQPLPMPGQSAHGM